MGCLSDSNPIEKGKKEVRREGRKIRRKDEGKKGGSEGMNKKSHGGW